MAAELPVYRTEELSFPDMRLPGYRKPGNLSDMITIRPGEWGATDWFPVLSLSIFRVHPDDPTRLQTLTGVRQNTTTHEGVVSTLTSAIPPAIASLLIQEKKHYLRNPYPWVTIGRNGPDPFESAVVASYKPNLEIVPGNHDTLPFLCHDIFSRKLGAPELIDMHWGEKHLGQVSLSHITIGLSYVDDDPDGTPLWEPLMMLGAAFILDKEYANAIPNSTKRYRSLGWTDDTATFARDVREKDVINLAPYIDEGETVEFCARGLCLGTTAILTAAGDLRDHLGLSSQKHR